MSNQSNNLTILEYGLSAASAITVGSLVYKFLTNTITHQELLNSTAESSTAASISAAAAAAEQAEIQRQREFNEHSVELHKAQLAAERAAGIDAWRQSQLEYSQLKAHRDQLLIEQRQRELDEAAAEKSAKLALEEQAAKSKAASKAAIIAAELAAAQSILIKDTDSHTAITESTHHTIAPLPPAPLRSGLCKTALYIAAGRALESLKPAEIRLFNDPFATAFASEYGHLMLRAMATEMKTTDTMLADYIAVRTKFMDEVVINSIESGIKQLVILSVGGDSRSLRMPLNNNITVYELDLEESIEYRKQVIQTVIESLGTEIVLSKAKRIPVSADVSNPNWISALESAGFNRHDRSLFIIEGLLMYLTTEQVNRLLRELATLCSPHSKLVGDMLNNQYFLHTVVAPILNLWERWSARPVSGSDLPEAQFASAGFSAQVKQFGQDPEVDFGLIPQSAKDYYLKLNIRGATKDIPRNWLFTADRS